MILKSIKVFNLFDSCFRSLSKYRGYILLGLILFSLTGTALAHDWYPQACCSGQDCHPIPCQDIIEKDKGFMSWDGYSFAPDQIHPSLDSKCHACISSPHTVFASPHCLFIQNNM